MPKNQEKNFRQELKFVLPAHDRYRALCWIRHNKACFYKEYPDRRVNNIYFDSYDYTAFGENLSGISSRKKTRYRWYGPSPTPDVGAMELKYKRNQFNWKWIYKINEIIFQENVSWHFILRKLMFHLPPELCRHLQEGPVPALVNRYQRNYFRSREDNIRVTLDTELSFHKQGRISPNFTGRVSSLDNIILEVKFPVHLNNKVSELMSSFPFPVSRCSKYCIGVKVAR